LGHLDPGERDALLGQFLSEMQEAEEKLRALQASLQGMEAPAGFADHWAYQLATLEFGIAHHRFVRDWYQAKREELSGAQR
jgi:hypothetical protein